MRKSLNPDLTTSERILRLYQKLLFDGKKHYLSSLAAYLGCSPQTVMRLITDIENVIGASLVTGLEKHRRWYQIRSLGRNSLGLQYEELRYLAICRDLASPFLSRKVKERVDQSLFAFSMLMADQDYAERKKILKKRIGYNAKGWIDYAPYFPILEKLSQAQEESRVCLILYRAPGAKTAKLHRFAFGKIIAMHNALYVIGASLTEDFQQERFLLNLAVHRMKEVTLTDRYWKVEIPEDDLSMFGLPWHEPRKFAIRFKAGKVAEYVEERVWSRDQKMSKERDGSLILEMESRSEPEIRAWIGSFGNDAELLRIEESDRTKT